MLVQPLSDVPTCALWGVALWAASRGGTLSAAGAGVAGAYAIMIRPNLAPLAGVIALIVASRPLVRLRDLLWFAAAAAPGPAAIAFLNAHLYGSALSSGYGSLDYLYSIDRIWPNLVLYGGWFLGAETPLIFLGMAAPFIVAKSRVEARLLALITYVFPAAVLALYLPYFIFDVWWYLRFLLPAYPPLLAATGAVVNTWVRRVHSPIAAIAAAVVVAAVAVNGIRYSDAFTLEQREHRYRGVAEYVAQLPSRAVFVSLLRSGSLRDYAARDVLRWELVEPSSLDIAVAHIRKRGYDVYLVGDTGELDAFRTQFAKTRVVRELDRGKLAGRLHLIFWIG